MARALAYSFTLTKSQHLREKVDLQKALAAIIDLVMNKRMKHTHSDRKKAPAAAYLFPFAVDALGCDGSVGVCSAQLDAVALGNLLHLSLDGLNGLPLLVGLCQSGLELLVGCDQTLK